MHLYNQKLPKFLFFLVYTNLIYCAPHIKITYMSMNTCKWIIYFIKFNYLLYEVYKFLYKELYEQLKMVHKFLEVLLHTLIHTTFKYKLKHVLYILLFNNSFASR